MIKNKRLLTLSFVTLFAVIAVTTIAADPVDTSVVVGNSAPSFSVGPAESPASDATTPTNVGAAVTFQATGSDSNNENYYLAICKTNSVTPVNGAAPTCAGGNWCISSGTASGSQATCNYTALVGDAESNAWFAFVCDGNSGAASCSSSSQGTGASGSPFKVNHAASFSSVSNDGPANPGEDIIWTTTASDADTDGTADTVKLVICKTTGLAAGDCDGGAGDRWCQSSLGASNPTCTYSVPSPNAAGSNAAFAYVVDNHNFAATGSGQASSTGFTVSNVAPQVSNVSLNGGSDIALTADTTTGVVIGGTVTDANSCQDISAVQTSLYRTGLTYAGCDDSPTAEDDDNECYALITCSVVGAGNTCTGAADSSADYTCTVAVQYHASPTTAGTEFPTDTWSSTIKATDAAAAVGTGAVGAPVEMLTLIGYEVTATINYGNLGAGDTNDPLDKVTTLINTGNVGLDTELSGTDMASGGNTIGVANQKFALAASTAYASGAALSVTDTEYELNVGKPTSTAEFSESIWWGLSVPGGTASGTYSGSNTITAVLGEVAFWYP